MTEKSIYVHDLVVLLSSIMFCLLNVMQIMKFSLPFLPIFPFFGVYGKILQIPSMTAFSWMGYACFHRVGCRRPVRPWVYPPNESSGWALPNGGVHTVAEQSSCFCKFYGSKRFNLSFDTSSLIPPGIVHDDLKNFLEANVSIGKKKSKVTLGVSDPRIGAAIQESVNIQCESDTLIIEVTRGVRVHFEKMIKGLTGSMSGKAQLGLGHSYSRAKVKFNIHRVDNMIIQSISLLDQLDKDINTFSMRIRFVVVYVISVSEWAEEGLIDCSFD